MAELNRAGQNNSLGDLNISQGNYRAQSDYVSDAIRQLAGNADIEPGANTVLTDPLSAPYVLYVNPYTGSDDIEFGNYSTPGNATPTLEEFQRRIELQRLTCGYTEARPFRTINRAALEAALISSKNYLDADTEPFERISIMLAPGTYDVACGAGLAANDAAFVQWTAATDITQDWLARFNPQNIGGLILPRNCSLCSLDLRKVIIRPDGATVQALALEEGVNFANRRTIFRVTGEGYYFGMTFGDADPSQAANQRSHHLMSCFEFASEAQLDDLYTKLTTVFSGVAAANLVNPIEARNKEWQIVGEQPETNPDQDTDTVRSASPYIYNCSIRSVWGLSGIFANGAEVGGFRSMVVAQFTGVSLQRDMRCWQQFTGGAWVNIGATAADDYQDYIDEAPDDVRMHPDRLSCHVRAVNNAIIQEVSVFAIGQGVHHWVESGGELTVTNSNSNFGGVASRAEGFQLRAFPQDINHSLFRVKVPTDMTEEENNIRQIFIGTIDAGVANDATNIDLTQDLEGDTNNEPDIIGDFTLVPGSFLWVEVPNGADYRREMAATPWDTGDRNRLVIANPFQTDNADGNNAPGSVIGGGPATRPDLAGLRVYIRRPIDTRTPDERRYSLILGNTNANARLPQRDYVIANNLQGAGGNLTNTVVVGKASPNDMAGAASGSEVECRWINPDQEWTANTYYRPGDPVRNGNKHFICTVEHLSGGAFAAANFEENFVHMPEAYNPEDFFKNVQPTILFDNDSDQAEGSLTCGWIFSGEAPDNCWDGAANATGTVNQVNAFNTQAQFRRATDFRGVNALMGGDGLDVTGIDLTPTTAANRFRVPTSVEVVQMRRPSNIRLFGHAFEWAGFANYTKAIPRYQGDMTAANKFTYYATNEAGGRVYFSGFNEEGFNVSPRGVEDIQTGELLAPEAIGAPDRAIDVLTEFPSLSAVNLSVSGLLNLNDAVVSGSPTWTAGVLPDANTVQRGIIEIATQAEVTTGTDAERAVTPATLEARLTALVAGLVDQTPSGVVQWHSGATPPTGWLVCDGTIIPDGQGTINNPGSANNGIEADFGPLRAVIGDTYGELNNLGARVTGRLPNLQGSFVRGWTSNNGGAYNDTLDDFVPGANWNPDPSRVRGLTQLQAMEAHSHNITQTPHTHQLFNQIGGAGSSVSGGGGSNTANQNSGGANADITITDVTGASTDGNETRPTNIALLPIIKI